MINTKKYSLLALGYFLLIAILGVLLRSFPVADFNFNYKHVVHAHSHIALLGWVYTAFMVLIYQLYLRHSAIDKKYKRLFWFTQFTIVGMLASFPFTGYALFSILFSTLFLITSYAFSHMVFKHTPITQKQTNSFKCMRIGLWYMIISSIGPLALGVIMNTLGSTSSWYRNAIYFYLHFQYNGWFILALFGVLIYVFERHDIKISKTGFNRFYIYINLGVILTFTISILWMGLHSTINGLAGIGGLIQIVALVFLVRELYRQKNEIKANFTKVYYWILKITLICFSVKLLLQYAGTFPNNMEAISSNIDFIIGYLHWVFLGVVSLTLLGFLNYFKLIKLTKTGLILYVFGFLLLEAIIFYKGLTIWLNLHLPENYLFYILISSIVLLIGILVVFVQQFLFNKD
ncbi:hypothetical protein [Seonamhaeicola maritimus]|uniref:Cytochrome C oxidase subunit I n=1 Tax=Seonamhaeicola maritimus TaxID=2591822 RepID=A0A5C7GEY1_9FLAO|nr:hypothetical protein [Seonamhaeicola maritimus]TXG35612.1 hypothetical protein FUA22_13990 [Seonamhaeicola maritimus]